MVSGPPTIHLRMSGSAERDISADLRGALPPSTPRHHASVTDPEGVAALLRAIDGYRGSNVTRYALQLAPLVFVRPGELRKAEWIEIDLEAGEWRIPAERMKMKTKHIVPLSTQAVAQQSRNQPHFEEHQSDGVAARHPLAVLLNLAIQNKVQRDGGRRCQQNGVHRRGNGKGAGISDVLLQVLNIDPERRQNEHSRDVNATDDAMHLREPPAQPVGELQRREQQRTRARQTVGQQPPLERLDVIPVRVAAVDNEGLVVLHDVTHHQADAGEQEILAVEPRCARPGENSGHVTPRYDFLVGLEKQSDYSNWAD
jgi:hypothetical protein